MTADVVVVGGGPAGLASAIGLARRGVGTILVEWRQFPIDKPCGEGLLPNAVALLEDLGVTQSTLGGAAHQITGIEYQSPRGRAATADFVGAMGLGVRRVDLSRVLVEEARRWPTLEIVTGQRGELAIADGRVEVRIGADRIRPRLVIAADGLGSRAGRSMGIVVDIAPLRRWGARQHFEGTPWSDRVEVYFAQGCDAYVTPVAGGVNIAILWEPARVALPPGEPAFDRLVERVPALARRLAGRRASGAVEAAGPFRQRPRERARDGLILLGDAGGYLDPLTGEGVGLALGQASALVSAVLPALVDGCVTPIDRATLARAIRAGDEASRPHRQLTRALLALTRRPALVEGAIAALGADPVLFRHCLAANMGQRAAWRLPVASLGRLVATAVIDLAAVRP